ncbi:MAG: ATP-binding protein, partial [archaeon]
PLSFREFLRFKNLDTELISKEKKAEIKGYLDEYIRYGGFPEISLEPLKKHEILTEYYSAILEKDIIYRYKLEADKVRNLSRYLLGNISNTHSYRSLGGVANLSPTTVSTYLACIENSFLIFQVNAHSYKIKEQLQYPRKIYCIDTGLRNAVSFRFAEDTGRLMENIVLIELKRMNKETYYWKDSENEVDFLIKDNLKPKELIQVCHDISDEKTRKREIKALVRCAKEFSLKEGLIITSDHEEETTIDSIRIKIVPMWQWLLQNKI